MAGKIADKNFTRVQIQIEGGIVDDVGGDKASDPGFLFGFDVGSEEFEVFGVNPGADVPLGDDDRTGLGKHTVAGDVIEMVVRVDDEFHGQLGEFSNFRKELFGGFGVLEGVNDGDAVFADDKTGVRTGAAFGLVDGRIDVVAERPQGEERRVGGGVFLSVAWTSKNSEEQRQQDCFAHGCVSYRKVGLKYETNSGPRPDSGDAAGLFNKEDTEHSEQKIRRSPTRENDDGE